MGVAPDPKLPVCAFVHQNGEQFFVPLPVIMIRGTQQHFSVK